MITDTVPNVRRLAAKTLPSLKRVLVLPTDANAIERLTTAAGRLSLDGDSDVAREAKLAAEVLLLIEVSKIDALPTAGSGAGTDRSPNRIARRGSLSTYSRASVAPSSANHSANRSAVHGSGSVTGAADKAGARVGSSSSTRSRSSERNGAGRMERRNTFNW